MKTPRQPRPGLRAQLAEARETLRAIRGGEVDALVGTGKNGPRVFTLEGAGHAYQLLIEAMNEGALTLTTDKLILYANQRFARLVKRPLEQIIGASFRDFLAEADRAPLRALLKSAGLAGSKIQMILHAGNGAKIPVLISVRPLPRQGAEIATVGMVVSDMTETRRTEKLLRDLSRRLVQAQEAERGRVALELHDHITQLLCAILIRSQALANELSTRAEPAHREAGKLHDLLGEAVAEVERISRNLRPSVLDHLGLVPALRGASTEFAERTGVALKLTCGKLTARLPAEAELACFRILQEALKNVTQHARATRVTVDVTEQDALLQLTITDNGSGFDPDSPPARRKEKRGLGFRSMRERAIYVGGVLTVTSVPGAGTVVRVQIPFGGPPPSRRLPA